MSFDRIILEYPVGWIDPGADPLSGQHLQCLETIKLAANQLGLGFSTRTSLRMADFAPRIAPDNALLISVHTVGIAKNVVRLKESYLPGYYYFDRTGYSGWAEIAYNSVLQGSANGYVDGGNAEFLNKIRHEKVTSNSSKYPQDSAIVGLDKRHEKPYIFLALQTTDDLVARLAYIDQIKLAYLLAEKAEEQSMQLVVKRHPLCIDTYIETSICRLAEKFNCVRLTSASVNKLIPDARAVVTVNSGVGFEALIMGVPVISAGLSDYSFVTHQLHSGSDIEKFDFVEKKTILKSIDNFLCFYLKNYCLHFSNIENAKFLIQKWGSEQYSSMHDLLNERFTLLDDIQFYMADLENMRRSNLLKHDGFYLPDSLTKKSNMSVSVLKKIMSLKQRIFS